MQRMKEGHFRFEPVFLPPFSSCKWAIRAYNKIINRNDRRNFFLTAGGESKIIHIEEEQMAQARNIWIELETTVPKDSSSDEEEDYLNFEGGEKESILGQRTFSEMEDTQTTPVAIFADRTYKANVNWVALCPTHKLQVLGSDLYKDEQV